MRIVASSSPASNATAQDSPQARCPGCGSLLSTRESGAIPTCATCRRSHAEHEAWRLLGEVGDLASGIGVYAELTEAERREQIQALVNLSHGREMAKEPRTSALEALVGSLSDACVDVLADLVSRRIADRREKQGGQCPTLVRVAVADLPDAALIDLAGLTNDPILLNAATAELVDRLARFTGEDPMPLYTQPAGAAPDAATRYELEGRIEIQSGPVDPIEQSLARAA